MSLTIAPCGAQADDRRGGEGGQAGPYVVGIDLGGTKILAGLADASGTVLATLAEPTEHGAGAPVLAQMARVFETLAERAGLAGGEIARLVIGVPAVVSPRTGLASLSPNLDLPADRPLADLMAERVACPVTVENDVNLAALAEAAAGAGEPSLAFVSFGTGAGMGLVIDGQLVRGAFGRAGEIAYLPVGAVPHERAPTSENGLFEDVVGTPGVRSRHAAPGETVAQLFARAEAGDAAAAAAIDAVAKDASTGVAAVFSLIDPALVVIGGGIGSQPRFLDALKAHLTPLLPFPCRLEPSRFGAQAGMIGATTLGLQLCDR